MVNPCISRVTFLKFPFNSHICKLGSIQKGGVKDVVFREHDFTGPELADKQMKDVEVGLDKAKGPA